MRWWTLEMLMMLPPFSSARKWRMASRAHRNADHLVEVVRGKLVRRPRDLDAGVVDEDVDPTELLDGIADHPDHVVLAGDVALDEHVTHAGLPDLVDAGVHLLLRAGRFARHAQVVDRNVGAVLCEPDGDRLADARGSAGDENVLALQTAHSLGRRLRCGHCHLALLGFRWSG
jgi:hypothetical protein